MRALQNRGLRLVPIVALAIGLAGAAVAAEDGPPDRVTFISADGHTTLVGYVFKPAHPSAPRGPAVVMMHGRAGAYSTRANGVYDATTLSPRHKAWGHEWARAGYIALLVDGFGPRGYPQGFPRFSYDSRPDALSEVTVRPRDAAGALAWLRTRPDVMPDRIGLQGWSNGASTVLAALSPHAPGVTAPTSGFRAALAFYPACGLKGVFEALPMRPYAPLLVLHGTADEEVSYKRCAKLVEQSRAMGGPAEIMLYPGATHDFDAPIRSRQANPANAAATADAIRRSREFFARWLGTGAPSDR
jgi:carboxymethylenebutenolidase